MIKKSIFTLVAIISATLCFSQESNFFVKAGLNVANVSISDKGNYDNANALASFHAGIMADLPLSKYFSIQPALLFTGKGVKAESGNASSNTYFKATSNPYYVELPVNMVVKFPLAMEESNFFFGAGPYIAAGIAGKNKAEGKILGINFKNEKSIDFSNDDATTVNYEEGEGFGVMKRFDYGLNGTAGLELKNLLFSVNYGYGLAKIASNDNNTNNKNKHRVLSFSVGIKI